MMSKQEIMHQMRKQPTSDFLKFLNEFVFKAVNSIPEQFKIAAELYGHDVIIYSLKDGIVTMTVDVDKIKERIEAQNKLLKEELHEE